MQKHCADPLWMDGVHFSRRINLELTIDCRRRSHCRRKRKQAGKTNVLLCSKQSIVHAIPPSIIHLKKESLVCYHTCSSGRKCTIRSIGFGLKLAQSKGLELLQTRQTRSCTTRRHLNLKLSRKSRYSVSLRETGQASPLTQPKQTCVN